MVRAHSSHISIKTGYRSKGVKTLQGLKCKHRIAIQHLSISNGGMDWQQIMSYAGFYGNIKTTFELHMLKN